jgi:hypothetical protein
MFDTTISECAGHLVDPRNVETLDVLGVQFLTPPRDGDPCVMRGTVPLGITVPLHSQPDPETFIQVPGEIEWLSQSPEACLGIHPTGRYFPCAGRGEARLSKSVDRGGSHVLVSTSRIGRFFREVGEPIVGETRHPNPPLS